MDTETLRKPSPFWVMIASTLISFAVTFTYFSSKVSANENDIKDINAAIIRIEEKLDIIVESINKTTVSQAEVKKDIEYIKSAIIIVSE